MKTLYSRRTNRARNTALFGAVALVLIIIFGIRFGAPSFFFALTAPLMQSGSVVTASVGNTVSGFTNATDLAAQNKNLEAQILELKNQNQALTTRTQDLTRLLGNSPEELKGTPVGVIARPPESPYDTLVIGLGSDKGIAVGDQVFAQGGVPVGTVSHTTNSSAQVNLYSSAGRVTSGWVGEERTALSLTGAGSGAFTASLPKGSGVAVGDLAYLPGPGAIPMGIVVRIDTDPSSPSEILRIKPMVNIFSVTWVLVTKSH